jgi:hypothetical protein
MTRSGTSLSAPAACFQTHVGARPGHGSMARGDRPQQLLTPSGHYSSDVQDHHPEYLTDPRIYRPYRVLTIMSTRTPLTCSVLAGEQYGRAGNPSDHEQSGCPVTTKVTRLLNPAR